MREFFKEKYIFLVNKEGIKSFIKIYPDFFKLKKKFYFYEDIQTGKKLKSFINLIKKNKLKLVCIGGGRVSDLAKYASFKSNCYLITIPTILATHVYASQKIHVLKPISELGYKFTIEGKSSDLSLIDKEIINKNYKKNKRFILSGLGDLMAFYNSKLDWQLSDNFDNNQNRFSLFVIKKVETILEELDIKKPINIWLKNYIFAQILLCDLTYWVGSAPASGSEHLFANIFEKKNPEQILHGELVALGTLIFRYLRNENFTHILDLMKKFKIKKSLNALKVSKKKILEALVASKAEGQRKKRFTIIEKEKFQKIDYISCLDSINKLNLIKLK